MTVVDAHYHLGDVGFLWPGHRTYKACVDSLIQDMDENNVDITVVFDPGDQTASVLEYARAKNDAIALAAGQYPERVIGFAHVSPTLGEKDAVDELERAVVDLGLRGLGEFDQKVGGFWLDLNTVGPLLKKASELAVPVNIHSGDPLSTPDRIGFLAQRFPDLTFIMAHMGMYYYWREALEVAQFNNNVILETSGFYNRPDVIIMAVERVGPERIVMGSDGPFFPIDLEIEKIRATGLDEDTLGAILGGNMMRILDL